MTTALIASTFLLAAAAWGWHRSAVARRAALEELRERAESVAACSAEVERLRAGLSGASDGLIVVDERGLVAASNPAARDIANLPDQDHRGARIEDLIAWPKLHAALRRCRDDHTLQKFELEIDEGEPHARRLSVRCQPLPGRGAVVGIDDQSRIRRLESLRRDFVANVSHELKTPLTAIQGFVETVLDDPDMSTPTRTRFLERIAQQTQRLTTLVSDLLTLSRLDDDKAIMSPEPVDMVTVIQDAVRDLMPIAEREDLEMVVELPDQQLLVRAEQEALRQVAGNLIDNALKYTPERGVVTLRLTNTGDNALRLEVVDTGIGLSKEDQERVFERFYRVDRARSRQLGGTGLGLSIVKNTVLNLGGEMGVKSEVGVGSLFWIQLPLAPPPAEPPPDAAR